jgi:hypothetical protein
MSGFEPGTLGSNPDAVADYTTGTFSFWSGPINVPVESAGWWSGMVDGLVADPTPLKKEPEKEPTCRLL